MKGKEENMTTDKMLQFVNRVQELPQKRHSQERKDDFEEITFLYDDKKAKEQAGRCEQCGIPYCQIHCPLGNYIPDWLMLEAEGRMREAYMLSSQTNSFPEICGRICPQDRLCEGNCVVEQSGHDYVTIGSIEKYITEYAFKENWVVPIKPHHEKQQHIAIIGAGPAGLTAAIDLRKKGFQVTIYDRYDRVGGLLIYGIPNFKLEKNIVKRREKWIRESGVIFKLNENVEENFQEIKEKYDAVLIATGVYKTRNIDIDHEKNTQRKNIVNALDFLTRANKIGLSDIDTAPHLSAKEKKIVVVGGGDTAMDCVRTAIRQGALSVTCLYRRDKDNMPGSIREVQHAEEEGALFRWLCVPTNFIGEDVVTHIEIQMMRLDALDATGRASIAPITGKKETLEADMVVMALGFEPENVQYLFNDPDIKLTPYGTIETQGETGKTSQEHIFAAGDIVRGASLVVWAIKDGKDAAKAISSYLDKKASLCSPTAVNHSLDEKKHD